ncbi:MAG: MFS transporter [Pseudochelatococcus sp.]|jgi:MFS family permease|uniref:MFS transporter n=1 Tax=Pseudochelatococcus sp. TaxID=2020869 RepID=UPI003D932FE0
MTSETAAAGDGPRDVWRTPGYRVYLASRFIFHLVNRMLVVVLGWHVYGLTNDPLHLGYVGLAMFAPVLAVGLAAGDLADRFNRAGVVAAGSFTAFLASAGLLLLSLADTPDIAHIYIAAGLFGTAIAVSKPALWALLGQVVPARRFPAAVSLSTGAGQVATIFGPALAGLLLLAGLTVGYAGIAVITFIAIGLAVLMIPAAAGAARAERRDRTPGHMLAGIRYIWSTPVLLGMVLLDLFAVLFGSVVALLPVFARDILDVGPAGLGALRAAPAVGATAAAFFLARAMPRRGAGAVMLGFSALFGISATVFALSEIFLLSLIALAVGGVADMVSVVMRQTVLQLGTPDAMRGRVNAAAQVFISASNEVGDFRAGAVAGWLGAAPAAAIGGLCTVAIAAGCAWAFPALRHLSDPRSIAADRQS